MLGAVSEERHTGRQMVALSVGAEGMVYGSGPPDSALAGAERWAPSAPLPSLLLLHRFFFPLLRDNQMLV